MDSIDAQSPLNFKFTGVAGQSFGAFAVPGMQLVLEGMANDFVGKGLCGGELILRGQGARRAKANCTSFSAMLLSTALPVARSLPPDERGNASRCVTPEHWRWLKASATMAANT